MKKLAVFIMFILSLNVYPQSNVPVGWGRDCSIHNDEKLARSLIAVFGMDTVKQWTETDLSLAILMKVDSLCYVRKHITLRAKSRWFGEYRRKQLEKYLINNKIQFEFCFADGLPSPDEKEENKQYIRECCERNDNIFLVGIGFPGVLLIYQFDPDLKQSRELSKFEKICKRLNIKLEE